MRIIGIDPAFINTGLGFIDTVENVINYETVCVNSYKREEQANDSYYPLIKNIAEYINFWCTERKADVVVVETTMIHNIYRTFMRVVETRACVLAELNWIKKIVEVNQSHLKKSILGNAGKSATKKRMIEAVQNELRTNYDLNEHEADALALCLHYKKINEVKN